MALDLRTGEIGESPSVDDIDDASEAKRGEISLQEAFLQFRKKKQDELREKLAVKQRGVRQQQQPFNMERLRKKFLKTALGYMGVPYAQRYHSQKSPTFHSELFLDCCGLVRRVVRDLKEEFGFTIGPWNQAYQFDTLPIALSGPEEMKPGDLVFISGVYYNPKAKKQRHDVVHVEIWLGEGDKTLGARWQKGVIEIHDSYKFVSKSYHSMQYHFRSIDTWLAGECQSHCEVHTWVQRSFNPEKRSIFALEGEEDEYCRAYSQQQQTNWQQFKGDQAIDEQPPVDKGGLVRQVQPFFNAIGQPAKITADGDGMKQDQPPLDLASGRLPAQTMAGEGVVQGELSLMTGKQPPKASIGSKVTVKISTKRPSPGTFVICGGNAAPLVEQWLTSQGWVKLENKASLNFTLKWVEVRQHIDFKNFREGEQLVNRFPNIQVLTTKIGLLENLRTYCKLHRQKLQSFFPETYRMDITSEREEFLKKIKDGELWICKPTGANQGKGIFLIWEVLQLLEKLEDDAKNCKPSGRPTARIVQRYISNPLLLRGRKFDIRVYMLIFASSPWLVLYRDGYIRLCCEPYQLASQNLAVHLTNQYQQKKNPLYEQVKEETVWNFDKFQACLSNEHGLPQDWVAGSLTRKMISIMMTCFSSVKHKLSHAVGYFDLLGFDFMLDNELNVWLIEVNVNPAMHTNCSSLAAICPLVVQETLAIVTEAFGKCRRNKPPIPISTLKHFRILVPKC